MMKFLSIARMPLDGLLRPRLNTLHDRLPGRRRTPHARVRRGLAALSLCGGMVGAPAFAQVPFPPQSLIDATTQQQAIAVLGAVQAERSGYLLIDAPDVVPPGPYPVTLRSEIAGTSHLVLLRVSILPPSAPPPAQPEKVTVFAKRLEPGAPATATLDVEANSRQGLALFAYARGRWYVTTREVKLGKAVSLP
jgi:hypothetical protein